MFVIPFGDIYGSLFITSQPQRDFSASKSHQQAWKSSSQPSDQGQWSGRSWTHDLHDQEQCSGNMIPQIFSLQTWKQRVYPKSTCCLAHEKVIIKCLEFPIFPFILWLRWKHSTTKIVLAHHAAVTQQSKNAELGCQR